MGHTDLHALNLRRFWALAAAALVVVSCSPSSKRIPSPRVRGAAAQPCPNSANNTTTKSVNDGSALNLDPTFAQGAILRKAGGYILTEGFGIETGLDSHKSRITFSSGAKEIIGNPKGLIEVLNIPACTEGRPAIDKETLERCLSRASWEELNSIKEKETYTKILNSPWSPRKIFKQCTASVTIDDHDFGDKLALDKTSGFQRLRVWTAEHCYQQSYAKSVHLFLPTAGVIDKTVSGSNYISLPLHSVDGIEFSRSVVTKNGGGGRRNDPNLDKKMFILRSMDGRSADTYQTTILNGCLLKGRSPDPNSPFSKSKYIDCFSNADLATFKAGVDLGRLDEVFNESIPPKQLSDVRRTLLKSIVEIEKKRFELIRAAEKRSESFRLTDQLVKDFLFNILSRVLIAVLGELDDVFGLSALFVSQMDGISQARRLEAIQYEKTKFNIENPEALGSFKDDLSSGTRAFSGNLIDSVSCLFGGVLSCNQGTMDPPSTAKLEEDFGGVRSTGGLLERLKLKTKIKLNLAKIIVSIMNSKMNDKHPLKVLPTDDEVQVSNKLGAVWTRLLFESSLMQSEPFADAPGYAEIAESLQDVITLLCPSSGAVDAVFPVFMNREISESPINGRKTFWQFGLLGPGTLNIMPIVGTKVSSDVGFKGSLCEKRAKIYPSPIDFANALVPSGITTLPRETIVAIDVDKELLCLPIAGPNEGEFIENPNCTLEQFKQAAIKFMGRRVVYKFEGATQRPTNVLGPTDSGTLWTLMGLPAFALTSHNGELINGVVFDQIPDINTIDPDQAAPATDAQGNPVGTCN
ncbi:MAG: hypothetical protein RJB13_251 [Pseudomonadota bacterium]